MQLIASIILALFKAFPALEGIIAAELAERARAREAEALARKTKKETAIDEAIDRKP